MRQRRYPRKGRCTTQCCVLANDPRTLLKPLFGIMSLRLGRLVHQCFPFRSFSFWPAERVPLFFCRAALVLSALVRYIQVLLSDNSYSPIESNHFHKESRKACNRIRGHRSTCSGEISCALPFFRRTGQRKLPSFPEIQN